MSRHAVEDDASSAAPPTIATLTDAYRDGTRSPTDEAERFLASSPVGGEVDAFVSVDPEDVRRQADDSAHRIKRGRPRGPLEGVLVGIKDYLHVTGYLTRAGTSFLVEEPDTDATVVARLRAAGAVIAGKTRMTELGLSPIGVNPSDRSPRNPHDRRRPTGGSSSGSAAAVAAGLVPLAIGSDGGGSLRIPPALTGVLGLKPTFGVVEVGPQLADGWWSLDVAGPIARSAEDLATALSVLCGEEARRLPDTGGLRVGVDWGWWGVPDSSVDRVCRAALEHLDPVAVELAHLELAQPAGYVTALSELAAAMDIHARDGVERFGPDVQLQLATARALTAVDYVRAQQARTLLARGFARVFEAVDVVAVPTTAITAPLLDDDAWAQGFVDEGLIRSVTRYTFPANLVGLPAVALPVGVDSGGMPVSLQLVGRHGEETELLALAAALETAGVVHCPEVHDHGTADVGDARMSAQGVRSTSVSRAADA